MAIACYGTRRVSKKFTDRDCFRSSRRSDPCCFATAEQRNSGTAEQRNSGTAEQRNSGTADSEFAVVSTSQVKTAGSDSLEPDPVLAGGPPSNQSASLSSGVGSGEGSSGEGSVPRIDAI